MQGLNNSNTNLVTTPLKTTCTYNTQPITKEALLSYHSDRYAADKRNYEAKTHKGNDCKLTKEDVDGKINTGHKHSPDYLKEKLNVLYEDIGFTQFFSFESFEKDFMNTYLKDNFQASKEEVDQACKNYSNEHYLTRENDNRVGTE